MIFEVDLCLNDLVPEAVRELYADAINGGRSDTRRNYLPADAARRRRG